MASSKSRAQTRISLRTLDDEEAAGAGEPPPAEGNNSLSSRFSILIVCSVSL